MFETTKGTEVHTWWQKIQTLTTLLAENL